MIPIAEVRALQAEWRLRDDVIEKDYALGRGATITNERFTPHFLVEF